jgi:hypothetical protein
VSNWALETNEPSEGNLVLVARVIKVKHGYVLEATVAKKMNGNTGRSTRVGWNEGLMLIPSPFIETAQLKTHLSVRAANLFDF